MISKFINPTLLLGALAAFTPAVAFAVVAPPKNGTTPYTTHFVFHPKSTVDIPGVGKAVALEAAGPTENTAGEKFLDKMQAKCAAVSIEFGRQEMDRRRLRADGRRRRRRLLDIRHARPR